MTRKKPPRAIQRKPRFAAAIVGDLHCAAGQRNGSQKSHLVAGSRRVPIAQHHVQSLLSLIDARSLKCDVVLCPGDLAHQVCSIGMVQAWDHLREIQRALKSTLLLPTVGNHDVDSRHKSGADPFEIPKTIHPEFPRPNANDRDMFWNRGFYFSELPGKAEFIVLNTAAHHDEQTARRGTFDSTSIEHLKAFLDERYRRKKNRQRKKVMIAMMHHHPLIHSTAHYGSADSLEFGDQILELLASSGFQLVLHGHKHEPRITRHSAASAEQIVFAAGSFSAQLGELSTRTKHLFHFLEIFDQPQLTATLRTWEFTFGVGWQEASEFSAKIPHEVAIVSPKPSFDSSGLMRVCNRASGKVLRPADITRSFPALLQLLPHEIVRERDILASRGYKLIMDGLGRVVEIGKI